jgi:hypothetical protein
MPAVVRAPATPSVLERVEEAIGYAVVNGLWLRCSEYGVLCASSEARTRWIRDPFVRGVSPLGAAVLMHQPETTTLPGAAAEALDITLPYEAGLADGMALAPKSPAWLACSARLVYLKAYEQGTTVRIAVKSRKYGLAVVQEEG